MPYIKKIKCVNMNIYIIIKHGNASFIHSYYIQVMQLLSLKWMSFTIHDPVLCWKPVSICQVTKDRLVLLQQNISPIPQWSHQAIVYKQRQKGPSCWLTRGNSTKLLSDGRLSCCPSHCVARLLTRFLTSNIEQKIVLWSLVKSCNKSTLCES